MRVLRDTKTILLYRDGAIAGEIHPHFPATRWGGAMVINIANDLTGFKNYRLTPL